MLSIHAEPLGAEETSSALDLGEIALLGSGQHLKRSDHRK